MTNNLSRTWQGPEAPLTGLMKTVPSAHPGKLTRLTRKAALIPYTFVLLNFAAVSGLYHYLRGYSGTWESAH